MEHDKIVYTKKGEGVFSYEYIDRLRNLKNDFNVIAQSGGQENSLASDADIVIMGGNRGGSKTFTLLMESLPDIKNPRFNAVLLRNEKDDLRDMINTSYLIYSQFGTYNRSISDMTWNFGENA